MASAYMFSHYWPGDGVGGSTPPPSTGTGYSRAAAFAVGGTSAFLFLLAALYQPAFGVFWAGVAPLPWPLLRSWVWAGLCASARASWPYLSLRWRVLWRVVQVLYSPEFESARDAVQQVAVAPDMRTRKVWGEIGQRVGRVPGIGENVFRHLAATERMPPKPFGRLHERNLALELAHLALKEKLHRG